MDGIINCFLNCLNILGFFFGGFVSSWIIAKNVVNKKVEKEIQNLKNEILLQKTQKNNLKKNVIWILNNYCLTIKDKNMLLENEEVYQKGFKDGIDSRTEEIIKRIESGIESDDIFNNDWTIRN